MSIDKRKAQRRLHKLENIKVWQLVILFVLMAFVSATLLRLNNVGMIERRQAVYAADKGGDKGKIHERLYALQRYASSHMNANTGDVYLSREYDRDVDEITKQAEQQNRGNNNALDAVVEECRKQFYGTSMNYINCVKNGLDQLPEAQRPTTEINAPPAAQYRFSFISPGWSPDYAGFAVALTLLILIAIIVRIIAYIVLRIMVKHHYKSI